MCGVVLSYAGRKILVGEQLNSGRYEVNPDAIFVPGYNSRKLESSRNKKRKQILKRMGI